MMLIRKIIALIGALTIESLYIGFCLLALLAIKKKARNLENKDKKLAVAAVVFLCGCMINEIISIAFREFHYINYFYLVVLQLEILFLIVVTQIALKSNLWKKTFQLLLAILLVATFKVAFRDYTSILANIYFCTLTFVSISISFVYFRELAEKTPTLIIKTDPKSVVVFGIFFANSILLIANLCFLSLAIYYFPKSPPGTKFLAASNHSLFYLGLLLYLLTRACYVILFYSIKNAFK